MTRKILVIDDEPSIVELVKAYLLKEHYEVLTASDGPSGLKAAKVLKPDLVVLDLMLPGMDGLELMRNLRQDSNVYVIMLTAKTEETDVLVGLSVGADDYMTKPFSPRELVARIKAAFRRLQADQGDQNGTVLQFQHLRIDTGSRQVWVDEQLVELTTTEYELLVALARNPHQVLSRAQLLEKVWGYEYYGEERLVDVHLGHVRQKLQVPNLIRTVRGVGFTLEDEPQ